VHLSQTGQTFGRSAAVVQVAVERQPLLEKLPGARQVALRPFDLGCCPPGLRLRPPAFRVGNEPSPKSLLISLAFGLGLSMALLWMVGGGRTPSALAEQTGAEGILAPAGELRVCPAGPPTCDYVTVQAAVDAASPGDVIKVATGG